MDAEWDIKMKIYKWLEKKVEHGFIKSKLYWSILIHYCNKLTNLTGQ